VDNCPECNGFYREDRSYKKPRFDQRLCGPIIRERGDDRRIPVHDRLGGRVSVHDRLGAGTCHLILQEEGFMLMNKLSRRLILEFKMSTHITGIQRESLFMMILISLNGVQQV
jgi:hypothetical protein